MRRALEKTPLFIGSALLGSAVMTACGSAPPHGNELSIRRVALYETGVGYFERAAQTNERQLEFRVKRADLDRVLGTLAANVQSVGFDPVDEADPNAPVTVHVVLRDDAREQVTLSYLLDTPAWHPTYRIVLGERLQQWAIVQNQSGEDWADVELSLSTGTEGGHSNSRYAVGNAVTIPNAASQMVSMLSAEIDSELVHLFVHDPAAPAATNANPTRAVRFVNETPTALQSGPVSIVDSEGYIGQGTLEPLSPGATGYVSLGADAAIAIDTLVSNGETDGELVSVVGQEVRAERFSERRTTYRVTNHHSTPAHLYIRHTRLAGANWIAAPEGAQISDRLGVVPLLVPANDRLEFVVIEQVRIERAFPFVHPIAAQTVERYLNDPNADSDVAPALQAACDLRLRVLELQERATAFAAERNLLANQIYETARNLETVRALPSAADLRARFETRLRELQSRQRTLDEEAARHASSLAEATLRLNEAMQDIDLHVRRG